MKVVIAGASGFVGRRLIEDLSGDARISEIVALSRSEREASKQVRSVVRWVRADLASLEDTVRALKGVEVAIYLVHSMSPQARLSQGSFEDFDLLQADHFARACEVNQVKKVFYLGGLIPDVMSGEGISAHLQSRLEVERHLGSTGAQVTAFRAGLILGSGGSSAEMLLRLVKRLPILVAPAWSRTESEPVDVRDVVAALHEVLFRDELQGKVWELGGAEVVSYQDLMLRSAKVLNLKRIVIPVPVISPSLSRLWVSLVTGAPMALVSPLIKSLRHRLVVRPEFRILKILGRNPIPLSKSLTEMCQSFRESPIAFSRSRDFFQDRTVRSIQRFGPFSSEQLLRIGSIAQYYFSWLPHFLMGIISIKKIEEEDNQIGFRLRWTGFLLLALKRSTTALPGVESYQITRGFLKSPGSKGSLDFLTIKNEGVVLAVVNDFVPRLPWIIYRCTQAIAHLIVMRRFGKALSQKASGT